MHIHQGEPHRFNITIYVLQECVTDSEESGDEAHSGILNNVKSVDEEEKWMTVHSDKFRISRPDELDGVAEKWTTIRNQPDKSDQSDDSDEKVVIPNRPERADSILEEEARLKEIRRIQEERYMYWKNLNFLLDLRSKIQFF